MNNTELPTLQEFKQKAKELKKNDDSISTLGEALNTLSREHGYKNWNTIKTKLLDTSMIIEKGVLRIDSNRKPTRTLEFAFNSELENSPSMEYHVVEDSKTLFKHKSLEEANLMFLHLDSTEIKEEAELKAFELTVNDHIAFINGVHINLTIFKNEILPYRYVPVNHEIELLRNDLRNPATDYHQVPNIKKKIQTLKTIPDTHIFSNITAQHDYCSASLRTNQFNTICQSVLVENERLAKLKNPEKN